MNIILLGAPGAGKGTQADFIKTHYGVKHISTGDIFRYNIKNATEIGKVAKAYIDKGQLVPDEVTLKIVETALDEIGKQNFMLDGFPRNINQAIELDKTVSIDKVINISIDQSVLMDRICGRRSCSSCGNLTHITKLSDGKCPKCGEDMIQRADDKEETVKSRLEVYENQTAPLIEYYTKQGKILTVDGMGSPEEVFEQVKKVLK